MSVNLQVFVVDAQVIGEARSQGGEKLVVGRALAGKAEGMGQVEQVRVNVQLVARFQEELDLLARGRPRALSLR